MNSPGQQVPNMIWRRVENNSRKIEETEPKQNKTNKQTKKTHPVVDMTGNGSCKEQYHTGTWNTKSMNQGKSEVVKQEMARMKH